MATILGIDKWAQESFASLRGKKLGLITNHTGLDSLGRSTLSLLFHSSASLKAIFSPEHGFLGSCDDGVSDSRDPATNLPIFSLYGERYSPTLEQLQELDALVYDIQDIGVRFYTYISTLKYCLEAAAKAQIGFIVLDRPNPLGGLEIEGPLPDADLFSFVACHKLPIRHGLTVGELAKLFVAEEGWNLELEVVPLSNWHRADLWESTNLIWVNPSPNMRSLRQAFLYPGIGLLEFTNISVGRGTDTPFELFGAPWIDGRRLANALNNSKLPGVVFVPVQFQPTARQYVGQVCNGVEIIVTNRAVFHPVRTGLAIATTLRDLFSSDWQTQNYITLLANKKVFKALTQGATKEELYDLIAADEQGFREIAQKHLLYPFPISEQAHLLEDKSG